MAARLMTLNNREEWLKARSGRIGGSDAAAIIGRNPYMSNVDLWRIKTGRQQAEDISEKDFVKYGTNAEPHLRALFALDYPEYTVHYIEHNMWLNDRYPFAHASLDGWLTDKDGRKGILEIKTTNILQSRQKEKWDHRIPDNYYCQILWYLAVTGFEFVILKAQLKFDFGGEVYLTTRHYFIDRVDVEDDITFLMLRGEEFYMCITEDREPPLILNI